MPTLLGMAELKAPDSVQGRDFSKMPAGEHAALLNLPASFSNVRGYGIGEYRGLRTERYTYVRSIRGPWLLYDNRTDQFQMKNLVGRREYSGVQSKLERMLEARLREVGDEFLPGDSYVERARLGHYREATVAPGKSKSPWGDWESTM
jgi:arylsulfatase A-like enzyme